MPPSPLRDRKRERTRRAILEAAAELFETRGYEETTVADIAAAADVGTRTFFNYFASKEELLFPESDERVRAAVAAIASRRPGERPVEVLLRALRAAGDNPGEHLVDDLHARIGALRAQVSRPQAAGGGRAAQAPQVTPPLLPRKTATDSYIPSGRARATPSRQMAGVRDPGHSSGVGEQGDRAGRSVDAHPLPIGQAGARGLGVDDARDAEFPGHDGGV
ncbi:TetR/AcrR family transcriptional regulator [Nocardia abscessus]|uniref:TetR/AcrR family transcriptional regulator n=1 Tax=Nocardia abscessus TaxID=120957 RepID=UPI002453FE12|nr:helix-turn-helix domain-containing protein [Nocardia abscessus]